MGATGPWSPVGLEKTGEGERRAETRLRGTGGSHVWEWGERMSDHTWREGRGGVESRSGGGQVEV